MELYNTITTLTQLKLVKAREVDDVTSLVS